jgi:iron-sulfur cluster repair protein YtfE (RIC family)
MGDTNWGRVPLVTLLVRLEERHHDGARDELRRLRRLLEEELELRPDARGSLAAIGYAMHALDVVVGTHVGETAAPLFAHATALAMNAGTTVLSPSATSRLIHKLRMDHQRIETLLGSMKLATDDFAAPDAASHPLRELYAGLASWERSAREHAHLENDLLVGSILTLEPSIERDADPVALPIHTRLELSSSRSHEKRTVFCTGQNRSLDVEWCRGCAFVRRVTPDQVECTPTRPLAKAPGQAARLGERIAVGEAMSPRFVSVGPAVPAVLLAEALDREHARVAVIVDGTDRVIGTVPRDEADTARALQTAEELAQGAPCVREDTSLADAIATMVKSHTRFLPVVGRDGRVIGLLTDTDALRCVTHPPSGR